MRKFFAVTFVLFVLLLQGCGSAPSAIGEPTQPIGSNPTGQSVAEPKPFAESGEPHMISGSLLFRGIDGNLYVAHPGIETIDQITQGAQRDYTGYAWAGDSVVYAAQRLNADRSVSAEIVARGVDGAETILVDEPGSAPFFLYPSPDGHRVGFLAAVAGPAGLGMGSISIDGNGRVSHGEGQPYYAAWSGTGESMLTHVGAPLSSTGAALELQSVDNLATGEPGSILPFATGAFRAPSFRSDGSGFAVMLSDGTSSGIYQVSEIGVVGAELASIRSSAAFVWSPGGDNLAFIDGDIIPIFGTMVGKLGVIDARDAENSPPPVQIVAEGAIAFFWSPDGSKLLFFQPGFTSGGNVLVYEVGLFSVRTREIRRVAVIRPSQSFALQIIPYFDQYHSAYTIWSPDGRTVALNTTSDAGVPTIVLVDTRPPTPNQVPVVFRPASMLVADERNGIIVSDGIKARVVAVGTVPFFSPR